MSTAAKATEIDKHDGGHVLPLSIYLKVYGALVMLTGLTIGVSLLDLGSTAIVVAMAVAIVKGSLVAAYFMHLRYDVGFNRLVFVGSLLFLVIFFAFTMIDLGTRGRVQEEQDTFFLKDEQAAAKRTAEQNRQLRSPRRVPGRDPLR